MPVQGPLGKRLWLTPGYLFYNQKERDTKDSAAGCANCETRAAKFNQTPNLVFRNRHDFLTVS